MGRLESLPIATTFRPGAVRSAGQPRWL